MKKILASISIFTTIFFYNIPFAMAATDIVNDSSLGVSLNACWSMDETSGNRADSSGNGYTLTDNNSVLSATGLQSNAADFERDNSEYFTAANGVVPWGTNTLTIALAFKAETTAINQSFTMTARTGKGLNIYVAGGTLTFSKPNVVDLNYTITEDTNWHTAVFVASSTGMATYIDGVSVASNTNTSNFVDPDGDSVHIGAYLSGGSLQAGWYRDGLIDEMVISAKAWTLADVTAYHNSGSLIPCGTLSAASTPLFYPKWF